VQTFESAPAAAAPRRRPAYESARSAGAGRVHYVPVQRAGNGMIVPVRLNGRVVAPFLIDTGASYVLVPSAVADEAGIQVGPETRTVQFSTANGVVEQAVVTLDSVELGTAVVEGVPASISPTMEIGLLGLSFFNRFTYQVDAANGVMTLVENDLAASGDLRGGRSESQWRGEFAALRGRMEEVETRRASAPSTHGRMARELEQDLAMLERQLESLEAEADDARVPDTWRQ
jgi:aspartyl protease family protein